MDLKFEKITIDDVPFINEVRNGYAEDFLHDSTQYSLEQSYNWFKKNNPMDKKLKLESMKYQSNKLLKIYWFKKIIYGFKN